MENKHYLMFGLPLMVFIWIALRFADPRIFNLENVLMRLSPHCKGTIGLLKWNEAR